MGVVPLLNITRQHLTSVYLFFSGVVEDLLRLCLTSLTHSLNQDDCVDHFLSSTYSMQILQMCVTQHNTLLPLVLQVIIILYFVMCVIHSVIFSNL